MLCDRYWSNITKFLFHVFWKYWSRIQDFPNTIKRIFGICKSPSVLCFNNFSFLIFEISKPAIFQKWFGIFIGLFGASPKINNIGFGESWSPPLGPETMNMKGFRVFTKWILKVTTPKWSRITLRSFGAIQVQNLQQKLPPRPPQTPNP